MIKQDIVKLSATEELIIAMLINGKAELYGLQIVAASNGMIKRGGIYTTLDRMEEKGLLESREEDRAPGQSGIARRLYKPTGHGAKALREWQRRRDQALFKLSPSMG